MKLKAIFWQLAALTLLAHVGTPPALADSTSPRLAAYYDLRMLLCGDTAYRWRDDETPQAVATGVVQVGVGRDTSYALTRAVDLLAWQDESTESRHLLNQVA
tara:strand:+ start:361 stop:666 length:306 start_codon:yes stop_codon:yes gene_type:complete